MAWHKLSTTIELAINAIIYQMGNLKHRELRQSDHRWQAQSHALWLSDETEKWNAQWYVLHPMKGRWRMWHLDLLIPELVSFHLTLGTLGITAHVREQVMQVERSLQHSNCFISEQNQEYLYEKTMALWNQDGKEEESSQSAQKYCSCKLIELSSLSSLWYVCSDTSAKQHSFPQRVFWVQPNIPSCALSQNNCPLWPWGVSNTQWLARCPEIDHFIIIK